jgi:hypothetical protein
MESGKQTQCARTSARFCLSDVRALKADAAKLQLWAEQNAVEQHGHRTAGDVARNEVRKAPSVMRTVKPSLRLIQTHNRELLS